MTAPSRWPVDIIVKSKNCDVPPRLKQETVAKVDHATRFFDRLVGIEVVFSAESNRRIAEPAQVEVTARSKGHVIRALGIGEDHRAAADTAVARFERQLARYKARLVDRGRGRPRVAVPVSPGGGGRPRSEEPAEGGWPRPRIVRTKRFELAPMLPDDAGTQLELLGHEFFLFTNASTGRSNVVYRRKDGDLGLIEPAD